MEKEIKVYKITGDLPTEAFNCKALFERSEKEVLEMLKEEMKEEIGTKFCVKIIEMTKEKYEKLPEVS